MASSRLFGPANPQVLDENGEVKSKTDIRDITHLHHALDACVLGLSSHFIPNNGRVWELIVKRNPNDLEKRQLEALGVFGFNAENRFEMRDLDDKLKEQIRQRLAEKTSCAARSGADGRLARRAKHMAGRSDESRQVILANASAKPDGSRPEKDDRRKSTETLGIKPRQWQRANSRQKKAR